MVPQPHKEAITPPPDEEAGSGRGAPDDTLRAAKANAQARASRALIANIAPFAAAGTDSIETVPAIWHYTIVSNACSIPTLSRSFVVVSFQLAPVGSSVLSVMPPNPAAWLRAGVWDKTWDSAENFSAPEGPQFRFCPGDKNKRTTGPKGPNEGKIGKFAALMLAARRES